jgi:hypothetical protein
VCQIKKGKIRRKKKKKEGYQMEQSRQVLLLPFQLEVGVLVIPFTPFLFSFLLLRPLQENQKRKNPEQVEAQK